MDFSEWVHIALRWTHVFAAILWVGTTYYFTWLDGQLRKGGAVWMVHSGGFYTVEKQKSLGVAAGDVHWFRWEAAITWFSGFLLLGLVYYGGGALIDADQDTSKGLAMGVAMGSLIVGWVVYDLLARTPLARNELAFAVVAFVLLVATAYGMRTVLSGRATYIHIGAMMGTIMTANVWMRILPPQRRMIAAMARGETVDPAAGAGAKLRSKHNTFMAVPVAFIMISNHFPSATYGSDNSVVVLAVLILVGWGAAAIIRRG
jgi:uncharacterized membrane protein